jgi:hypothetical protein
MDISTFLILGAIGLLLIGLVLYMLNRSWGDSLPRHYELPTAEHTYTPPARRLQRELDAAPPDDAPYQDEMDEAEPDPDAAPELIPTEGLILIDHPLLVQAVERSLRDGGPATRYVVREDDQLYLSLDLIEDPVHRREAAVMIHKFQTSGHANVWDIISLASTLGRTTPR